MIILEEISVFLEHSIEIDIFLHTQQPEKNWVGRQQTNLFLRLALVKNILVQRYV